MLRDNDDTSQTVQLQTIGYSIHHQAFTDVQLSFCGIPIMIEVQVHTAW